MFILPRSPQPSQQVAALRGDAEGYCDRHAAWPFCTNSQRQRCVENCRRQSPDRNRARTSGYQSEELIAFWPAARTATSTIISSTPPTWQGVSETPTVATLTAEAF